MLDSYVRVVMIDFSIAFDLINISLLFKKSGRSAENVETEIMGNIIVLTYV